MNVDETQLLNFCLIFAIIFLGTIGNVVSFIVFYKGKICRTLACSTYFRCLAVADTFVLLFPGLQLLMYLPPISFQYNNLNAFFCKASTFNVVLGAQVSAWIIIVVTVERTMTICRPLQFRVESAFFRPYLKIATIVIFFSATNCFYLVDNQMIQFSSTNTGNQTSDVNDNGKVVYPRNISASDRQSNATLETTEHYDSTTENAVLPTPVHQNDTTLSSLEHDVVSACVCYPTSLQLSDFYTIVSIGVFSFVIPLVINLTCNLLILYQLHNRLRDRASSRGESSQKSTATKRGSMRTMMYRMMAISVVHIVSTGPIGMLMFLGTALVPGYILQLFNALYYLNSGVNFLLYCVTGKDFRHDFTELFVCKGVRARPYTIS